MSVAAHTSPFKFLDSYGAQDSAVFFGRDEEIEALYRLLAESRLVLVYGQSGTGKTSLVQCGLTHKFSPTNWLPLTVRRGDDMGASLIQTLTSAAITPLKPGATTVEAIRSVYLDHLRPVFLIFDQFEELYVLGTKDEQEAFYASVKAVLEADVSCRIIVLLREEYLAALDPFERLVPSLFDKRLRVEVMTNSNVEKVIVGTCAANGIALEHGADTARLIIDQLDDKRIGVQLAYLQVYLDHLYRMAAAQGGSITFTDAAIAEAGKLGDVMAGFLDEQEKAIEADLGGSVPPGGIARLLEEFVSVDGTKQPSTYAEVLGRIPSAEPWLQSAIDLLQNSRLLRRVDDHYELAHDALASRIAERRSGERKQILMVEKLVQNRVSEFDQTRTLLNTEELALVKSAAKLVDPLDGSPLLKLGEEDARFVKKSRSNMWKRRIGIGAAVLGGVMALLTVLVFNLAQSQAAEDSKAKASNVADVLGFGIYHNLADREDAIVIAQIDWAHNLARCTNIARDEGDDGSGDPTDCMASKNFWGQLYDADVQLDRDGDKKGFATYDSLEKDMREAHEANPTDVAVLGKLKAVRWHHYFATPESDPKLGQKLFDVLVEGKKLLGDPIGFGDDLRDLCLQKDAKAVFGAKCDAYISNRERDERDRAATEAASDASNEPPERSISYDASPPDQR